MRKKLLTTSLLLITAICFVACSIKYITDDSTPALNYSQEYNSCYDCTVDDLHGETDEEFAIVTARYRTTHQELFNKFAKGILDNSVYPNTGTKIGTDSFQDARSCWFSADTLKKFICLMEKYAAKIGVPPSRLGLRFYYAVYPTDYDRDQKFSDRHTLYITATEDKYNTGIYEDFDPRMSAATGKLHTLSSLIQDSIPQSFFSIGGRPQVSMNEGDLCPPGKGCRSTINAIDTKKPFVPLGTTTH
jgi:hypothetical protein